MSAIPTWLLIAALAAAVKFLPALVYGLGIWAATLMGRLETRLTWPFAPLDAAEAPGSGPLPPIEDPDAWPTPAAVAFVDEAGASALAAGFRHLGTFRDAQSPALLKLRHAFWLSPDRLTLAMFSAGKVLGMAHSSIRLVSRTSDGRRLVTISSPIVSEFDPAGDADEMLIEDVPFDALARRHARRLDEAPAAPLPFSADPLGDLRAVLSARVEGLERRGLATYLDPALASWRYTLKGAHACATSMHAVGMRRSAEGD